MIAIDLHLFSHHMRAAGLRHLHIPPIFTAHYYLHIVEFIIYIVYDIPYGADTYWKKKKNSYTHIDNIYDAVVVKMRSRFSLLPPPVAKTITIV